MKTTIIGLAIVIIATSACNSANSNTADNNSNADTPVTATTSKAVVSKPEISIKEIVEGYLQLKNALVSDNGKAAAVAGNEIVTAINNIDTNAMGGEQRKAYIDIANDAKENAEHIGANAGKLDHQREHFEMLSKDIADLVKIFGNSEHPLYRDFCPMYNKGKGAYWISETKEIKNPYLGKAMPTCGTMKEELK